MASSSDRRRPGALRVLPAVAYTLAIFYGGVIDLGPIPSAPAVPADKLLHFVTFWGFEWFLELAFSDRSPRARRLLALAIAIGVGVALELVQSALPHRSAEFLDLLADTLGAITGALLLMLVGRLRAPRGGVTA